MFHIKLPLVNNIIPLLSLQLSFKVLCECNISSSSHLVLDIELTLLYILITDDK